MIYCESAGSDTDREMNLIVIALDDKDSVGQHCDEEPVKEHHANAFAQVVPENK
jgi:hypothetical protein